MSGWRLKYSPRNWQVVALDKWKRERRGIVEVVTGGGKTVFAQLCMHEFFRAEENGQILIIVPTVSLLDQWWVSLQEELGVAQSEIGLLSGKEKIEGDEPIIIAVINSARGFAAEFSKGRKLFLIVDECHRAGSPSNAKALEGEFAATLGLSATPEREHDEGFEAYIAPRLGPIIHQYTYVEAAKDGVISPFSLTNVQVDLLPDEEEKYRKLSRSIALALRKGEAGKDEERLKRLLQQRAAVVANATTRIPVAVKLIDMHKGERAVIFHERIEAANRLLLILRARRHRATVYHSEIGPAIRRDNLRLFRKGLFDVLVCCRALDEGINVPEASVAVIASSTASHRQRIQRLGRILRTAKGKDHAHVYTLFATEEERKRLAEEESSLEGISSVTWQKGITATDA